MIESLTKKKQGQPAKHNTLASFAKGLSSALALLGLASSVEALEPNKGDHIVLLGNTLAERMQHHGWLESYAQAAMPDKELVFRNHGFAGDKVDKRPRNRGFINPHDYLTISKADIILTFFGANEAWDKNPGNYKSALTKWIDETMGKKYNGEGAPRIVLFSAIAHENLESPNLPDGKEQNKNLAAYTAATAEVAKEKNLEYVDLFKASQGLYDKHSEALTINGIHLTNEGNDQLAQVIFKALFGKDVPVEHSHLKQTQDAVLDKNWHWFNRYRATDGNDVWGGRSGLRFTNKQSNRDVLFHELSMIDVMTANRDKVVHAAATGKTLVAADSNVPPPIKVVTHLKENPGGKEGSRTYVSAEETVAQL